jgi:sulfur-carrier protein adenylyltransferase/sulfurtransferase
MIKEVTPTELKTMIDGGEEFHLIDVREAYECDICNIGGTLIPLQTIISSAGLIPDNKKVVVYCRSGGRSATAIVELEKRFGLTNLYNLKGGILRYADDVDPTLEKY